MIYAIILTVQREIRHLSKPHTILTNTESDESVNNFSISEKAFQNDTIILTNTPCYFRHQ